MQLAVIMTVHNRLDMSLACLSSLQKASENYFGTSEYKISVFCTDDGSTDGTADIIARSELDVKLLKGNGDLFWNGGMLMAWKEAVIYDYDFYLWLNNDVVLKENAFELLFEASKHNVGAVVGATCNTSEVLTYGGRDIHGELVHPGSNKEIHFMNGNIVLIPRYVYRIIGLLDPKFRHGFGDWAYSFSLKEAGFSIKTTSAYAGYCDTNLIPDYLNCEKSFKERYISLKSPKGLPLKESYYFFSMIHNRFVAILIVLKSRINIIFCRRKII